MADASVYSALVTNIVKSQFDVIGPLAIDQAKMVNGITIDTSNTATIRGNGKEVLANLVKQFEQLFGQTSVEVCKDAIKESGTPVSDNDLPEILQ